MPASRTSWIAILALAAAVSPVAAQTGAPIPLLPPPAAAPGASAGDGIEAQPVAPTDAAWASALGPDQGGFPDTMWQGTDRALVAAALPLLQPSTSPVLQDLARRLLLSNAASPAGQDAPDRPTLAAERLDRLLALGDVTGAIAMTDGLPPDPTGDGMDRTRVELRFAAGDPTGACKAVQDGVARYQGVWWARALIACQAIAGESEQAALGLSLLRDEKTPPDPVFDALVAEAGGSARKIEKLPDPTPMQMTLLAAAKAPLPPDTLAGAGPASLLAYATSDKPPLDRRLAAAERAAALGALSADALAALYRSVTATPQNQTDALKDEKPPDAMMRAMLFGIARSSAPAATREAAMTRFLDDARKRGLFPLAARLLAPAVSELTPADASPDFAGEAARVLLVAGDGVHAQPWIDAAGSKDLVLVSQLGVPAGEEDGETGPLLHEAIATLASRDAAAAAPRADLLLDLAASFGKPVGGLDWAPLMAPAHDASIPNAALWLDQQRAADQKRLGETVLASILLVASGERLSLEPVLLGRAIAGLRAVGLEADARALAIEAAADAGI
jgi:hypothetical protein